MTSTGALPFAGVLVAALTRTDIANYVSALFEVYIALILIYILAQLVLGFGMRPPYSRTFDAVLKFLRDVCDPYLRLFRKFIPPLGMLDLSPMIAIIVLYALASVVTGAINGTL